MLKVNEIYCSILGESIYAGIPTTLVRLTGCNLRCSYCDTTYAYENGIEMSVEQILRTVSKYNVVPVLLTGGEPLLQEDVFLLMERLYENGYMVMLETNGSLPLKEVTGDVSIIMDVKCPGSGHEKDTMFDNLDLLTDVDNVKFVLSGRPDYDWALDIIDHYELTENTHVLLSPVSRKLDPKDLGEWMIKDKLFARLSLQLHKIVWGDDVQGR